MTAAVEQFHDLVSARGRSAPPGAKGAHSPSTSHLDQPLLGQHARIEVLRRLDVVRRLLWMLLSLFSSQRLFDTHPMMVIDGATRKSALIVSARMCDATTAVPELQQLSCTRLPQACSGSKGVKAASALS